jgi:hypothetical protein
VDADLALTLGLVGLVLAVPAAVAALADQRRPCAGAVLGLGGAGFAGWSLAARGGRLTLDDATEAVFGTLGRLF